nr:MAG TPA: hypothetical protein [Caudoviricetes sp.]
MLICDYLVKIFATFDFSTIQRLLRLFPIRLLEKILRLSSDFLATIQKINSTT